MGINCEHRGRAKYGSKHVTDLKKVYKDEIEYNDVESNVVAKLDMFAKRQKHGDTSAFAEEVAYSLRVAPYLIRHHSAADREEQRVVYESFLADIDDVRAFRSSNPAIGCFGCREWHMLANAGGDFVCGKCGCMDPPRSLYTKVDYETCGPQRPPRQQTYPMWYPLLLPSHLL